MSFMQGISSDGKVVDIGADKNSKSLNVTSVGNVINGAQIGIDQAAAFANNALVNTQVNVDYAKPTTVKRDAVLTVYNPSTVADLTVKIFSVCTSLGGGTRYALLESVTIAKSQSITGTTINAYSKLFQGLFVGTDLRIVVSNDTALGASDGFSAYVRLREAS